MSRASGPLMQKAPSPSSVGHTRQARAPRRCRATVFLCRSRPLSHKRSLFLSLSLFLSFLTSRHCSRRVRPKRSRLLRSSAVVARGRNAGGRGEVVEATVSISFSPTLLHREPRYLSLSFPPFSTESHSIYLVPSLLRLRSASGLAAPPGCHHARRSRTRPSRAAAAPVYIDSHQLLSTTLNYYQITITCYSNTIQPLQG